MRKKETISSQMMFCLTDTEDHLGSKALNYLREKLKHSNMNQLVKQKSHSKQDRVKENHRLQRYYIVRSNTKQPISFSQYRISSKQVNEHSHQLNSNEVIQKAKMSLNEADLLDLPIVNIQKQLPRQREIYNDFSKIIMEKYYQNTIKYEERQLKQSLRNSQNKKQQTETTKQNSAVKNYMRKLKNSRREQIERLNQSFDNQISTDILQCNQANRQVSKSLEKYQTIVIT